MTANELRQKTSKMSQPGNAYKAQLSYVKKIYCREAPVANVFGIERLWMLALATIPLALPITLIRHLAGLRGLEARKTAVEIYAIAKPALVLAILVHGSIPVAIVSAVAWFCLLDLYSYLLGLLFLRKLYTAPVSYGRSVLLLFVNYVESTVSFALLYVASGQILQDKTATKDALDALYFSVVTSATVGYGDIVPGPPWGRTLAMLQICSSFVFAALVVTTFVSQLTQSNKRT